MEFVFFFSELSKMGEWSRSPEVQVTEHCLTKDWFMCSVLLYSCLMYIYCYSQSLQSFDMRPHKNIGKLQSGEKVRLFPILELSV